MLVFKYERLNELIVRFTISIIAIVMCYIAGCSPAMAQGDAARGEMLFQRCSGCHKLDVRLVGPALGPIVASEADDDYLTKWIQNNQALIAAKEPRAVTVYNQYNQSIMPAFTELTNKDVADILTYVREGWKNRKEAAEKAADVVKTTGPNTTTGGTSWSSTILIVASLTLSVLCILVIVILLRGLRGIERNIKKTPPNTTKFPDVII